jgi:RimJ/RimL family protein N-acetyltransferase
MKPRQLFEFNEPVTGRNLQLRRLGPEHADYMQQSFADAQFWAAYRSNQNRHLTTVELRQRLDLESQNSPQTLGKIEWVIQRISRSPGGENNNIGLAGLTAFDPRQNCAEFLLGIVRSQDRKPGAGLEASLLLFDYAFNRMHLSRLVSHVYADNGEAQRNTLALGFRQEVLLRDHFRKLGESELSDVYRNGMLLSEFRDNKRLATLSQRLLDRDITRKADSTRKEDQDSGRLGELQASFEIRR